MKTRFSRTYVAALVVCLMAGTAPSLSAQATATSVRLVRVAAGPRGGAVNGVYRLDETRNQFDAARDSQAIVHFEWEGNPGTYHMTGRWTGPSNVATSSDIEYRATERRFGAFWVLPLSSNTPAGSWTLQALIEGVPAGSHTIEVVSGGAAAPSTVRPLLTPAQLFERLSAVTVSIATIGRDGYNTGAAGLLLGSGGVVTSFGAVDACDTLSVDLPGGSRRTLDRFSRWNRTQDWAILAAGEPTKAALPRASADPQVGDPCYSLRGGGGAFAITECSVVGRAAVSGGGPRLLLEFLGAAAASGAPVVNRDGELLGIVGSGFGLATRADANKSGIRGVPVVPAALIADDGTAAAKSMAELREQRVLRAPVVGTRHIVSGGFCAGMQREPLRPLDQRDEFTAADKKVVVFVSWDPQERLRGLQQTRLLNADNAVVAESKPAKIDFKAGSTHFSYFELSLPPDSGLYQAEVMIDGRVMWRSVFRVTR